MVTGAEKDCPKCKTSFAIHSGFGFRKIKGKEVPQSWCHNCRKGSWAAAAAKKPSKISLSAPLPPVPLPPPPPPRPKLNLSYSYSADKNADEFICSQAKRHKAPTHEENCELMARMREGDKRAREQFISRNLMLIKSRVNRFGHCSFLDPEDLFQEAVFGLVRAGRNFKPELGWKFSTYAARVIDQFIFRAIKAKDRLVKMPPSVAAKLAKVQRIWSKAMEEGNQPTQQQLADMCNFTIKELDTCKLFLMDYVYLDEPIEGEDLSLVNMLESHDIPPEDKIERQMDCEEVRSWLGQLDYRDRQFMQFRYGLNEDKESKTRLQLAQFYSISELEVQRWEKRALAQLKLIATSVRLNAEFLDDPTRLETNGIPESTDSPRDTGRSGKNPIPSSQTAGDEECERDGSLGPLGGSVRGHQSLVRTVARRSIGVGRGGAPLQVLPVGDDTNGAVAAL